MQRKIKWLVLLVWMLVIFLFSAQTGEQSSESSGLVEQLLSLFPFIPHQLFGIELQLIIRKGAHFTEYLILYVLIFNVIIDYLSFRRVLFYALLGVFLYAPRPCPRARASATRASTSSAKKARRSEACAHARAN